MFSPAAKQEDGSAKGSQLDLPDHPNLTVEFSSAPSRKTLVANRVHHLTTRKALLGGAVGLGRAINRSPKIIGQTGVVNRFTTGFDHLVNLLTPTTPPDLVEAVQLENCTAEWISATTTDPDGPVVIYFHGGGFLVGGPASHRGHCATIAHLIAGRVLNVNYRLLPKHPVTDAFQDGIDAYRFALNSGVPASKITFMGDSAGGMISLKAAAALKDMQLPRPAAIVCQSPWTDLDCAEKLEHPLAKIDPVVSPKSLNAISEKMVKRSGTLDPELSPVNIDLSNVPPTLIHTGTKEVLDIDSTVIAQRLAEHGVPTVLKLWQEQPHVFQVLNFWSDEAKQSISEMCDYIVARSSNAA